MSKKNHNHLGDYILQQDYDLLINSDEFSDLNLSKTKGSDHSDHQRYNEIWKMEIRGADRTYWSGQIYDIEIYFGKRFPFEAPLVLFPNTLRNISGVKLRIVDATGRLLIPALRPDVWCCTTRIIDIVKAIKKLFSENPTKQRDPQGNLYNRYNDYNNNIYDIYHFHSTTTTTTTATATAATIARQSDCILEKLQDSSFYSILSYLGKCVCVCVCVCTCTCAYLCVFMLIIMVVILIFIFIFIQKH